MTWRQHLDSHIGVLFLSSVLLVIIKTPQTGKRVIVEKHAFGVRAGTGCHLSSELLTPLSIIPSLSTGKRQLTAFNRLSSWRNELMCRPLKTASFPGSYGVSYRLPVLTISSECSQAAPGEHVPPSDCLARGTSVLRAVWLLPDADCGPSASFHKKLSLETFF